LSFAATTAGPSVIISFCGFTLPLTMNLLLEAPLDLLARRAMLRNGVVEHAAILLPRDGSVAGGGIDRQSTVVIVAAIAVFIGVPVAIVGGILYRSGVQEARDLVVGLLGGAAFVLAFLAPYQLGLRFIRQRLPFTKFPGPVSVSLLLDIEARLRYSLNTGMGIFGLLGLGLIVMGMPGGFLGGLGGGTIPWILVYAVGLFNDQTGGPIIHEGFEQIREQLERALGKLPANS
jgi:hypothetical protein